MERSVERPLAVSSIVWLGVTGEFDKSAQRIANCVSPRINATSVERLRVHVADIIKIIESGLVGGPAAKSSGGSAKFLHGSPEVVKLLQLGWIGLYNKRLQPKVKCGEQLCSASLLLSALGMRSCLALTFERESMSSDPASDDKARGNASSNNGGLRTGYVEQ